MFNDRVKNCEVSITVILKSIIIRSYSMQKKLKANDRSQEVGTMFNEFHH